MNQKVNFPNHGNKENSSWRTQHFLLASIAKTSCWDWIGLQVIWQDFFTFLWIDVCVCVWSLVGKSDMTGKDQSWALTTLPSSATTAWCLLKIYCPYKRCFCNLTKRKSTSSETCWTDQTIFELSGPIFFSLLSQISLQDLGFWGPGNQNYL